MPKIQTANVAGMFYPGDAKTLQQQIDEFLAQVKTAEITQQPRALIAPHAGYIYSGLTAAHAFATLLNFKHVIKRVVVAAPAHRYPFYDLAYSDADFFQTPLGEIPVAKEALEKIAPLSQTHNLAEAFQGEHALEVELPFLQTVLENFSLVPLLIGGSDPDAIAETLEKLWGDETLVVISSDLSHYLTYKAAQDSDNLTAQAILDLNPSAISHDQACGCLGIQAILKLAQHHKLNATQLDLRNSGDTAGNKDRVVGYGAFMFA